MELKNTYTSREVAAMTGPTARQLQWWGAGGGLAGQLPTEKTERGGAARAPRRPAAGVGRGAALRGAHRAEEDRARRLHRAPLHAGRSARAARARGAAPPGTLGRRPAAPARDAARPPRRAPVRKHPRRRG